MDTNKMDMEPDKITAIDRGEDISQMEPMLIQSSSRHYTKLADLALKLTTKATALRCSLPDGIACSLSSLVRSMNCYYSNLIEGHDTHPLDIERALNEDYSQNPKKRDLQIEARAHIEVQKWIDSGALKERAATTEGILEIHKRFTRLLPNDLLVVVNPNTNERISMLPGKMRRQDVKVAHHIPISPGALTRFMQRFESVYTKLGKIDSIIATAAAHHRLLWLHPFLDGNGRVARLMSYAMLFNELNSAGIWSIARGLARNENTYKEHLAQCDLSRRNDLDGRGNLSEEALSDFTEFFLETCIDQIDFMKSLMQPEHLHKRIIMWAETAIISNKLPQKSNLLLEAILYRGMLPRREIPNILSTSERNARRSTSALIKHGVLTSESSRAPIKLAFPAKLAAEWMPGLFPEIIGN